MDFANENKIIEISGERVAPGEHKLLKIPIDRLPTGTLIDIPVYVFNAKKPGPTLLIQAGLHGDEINGIETVRRMLVNKLFHIDKGAIIAVPVLNIFGFIHFSRDVPDGKDVNRSFPGTRTGSMASRIAYHYQKEIIQQIDVAIDLHTGGGQRHNYPQIRYTQEDKRGAHLATVFNAPFTFASKLIKGSFRNTAYLTGKPTLVFEAGESMRFDDFSIATGIAGILRILQYFGMVNEPIEKHKNPKKTIHLGRRKWLRAPTAGMFVPKVLNGAQIQKGATLGLVSDIYGKKTKFIKAPVEGCIICINHQAVVNQGDALVHIGELLK